MIGCQGAGAGRLIAWTQATDALRNALDLGATYTVNPAREDAKARVHEIIPGGRT